MSSAISPVRATLEAYLAGRAKAGQVVAVVAEAYYGERERRTRDGLQPVIDVIERAAPGAVELARSEGGQGFAIRAASRPFPPEHEAALRAAAEAVLGGWGTGEGGRVVAPRGVLGWVARRLRRFFG